MSFYCWTCRRTIGNSSAFSLHHAGCLVLNNPNWNVTSIWPYIVKPETINVSLLGLLNAGKTTLLKAVCSDALFEVKELNIKISKVTKLPTLSPSSEEMSIGNIRFTTYDLGGHNQARRVWKDYVSTMSAIVFLIDICDQERLEESKKELDGLLSDEQLSNCPILILGNKIDKVGALREEQLRHYFNLNGQTTGKSIVSRSLVKRPIDKRPLELFLCCLGDHKTYNNGFRWLAQFL